LNLLTEFSLSESWEFVLSGRARFDGENRLLDPEDSFGSYSRVSRPVGVGKAGYAELRDAYFEYGFDNGLIRLGKQQVVWGSLDGLKVTDVLNPQSFREFILEPFDESRVGIWSAYSDITVNDLRMEFVWLPDPTTHDLAEPGDFFEFTAPRFRLGGFPAATATAPGLPNTASGAVVELRGTPDTDLARGAVRLSAAVGGVTVSAIIAHSLDFEPTVVVATGSSGIAGAGPMSFERRYHDMRLYGLTLEGAIGSFALRAEAAYRPKRFFNALTDRGLNEERRDQWTFAIAADIDAPFGTFVNLQLLVDRVDKAALTVEGAATLEASRLVRPREDVLATMLLRKKFLYDTLSVDFRWYTDFKIDDGLYRVELAYAIGDNP